MLQTLWAGLVLGGVYVLVALGFSISMVPSGVFNFAQAAIVVVGTYLTYTFLDRNGLGLVPLLVVGPLIGASLGVACELLCVRSLRRGSAESRQRNELVTTVGVSIAIVGAIGVHWGYIPRAVPFFAQNRPVRFLGVAARPSQAVVIVGAIGAATCLHLWFRRTRWGQACLAVSEDRQAASLRGVNVSLLSLTAFAAAGAFGTLSAVAIGPITYAIPTLANTLALGGFVAIALGGQGSFLGILLGGLLAGVVSALATRYIDANYGDLSVLAVLLLTSILRPSGLGIAAAVRDV
jgi:branched-chain amino acid transport system permease protein